MDKRQFNNDEMRKLWLEGIKIAYHCINNMVANKFTQAGQVALYDIIAYSQQVEHGGDVTKCLHDKSQDAQDVILIACETMLLYNSIKDAYSAVDAYLYQSRKHSSRVSSLDDFVNDDGDVLDYIGISDAEIANKDAYNATVATVNNTIANFKPRQADIYARYINGYTEREIATAIGISQPAVHKWITLSQSELKAAF